MSCMDGGGPGRASAPRAEGGECPRQATPLAALLAQACRTVLDGQVGAVGTGLASAARTLLTCDDEGRPQPVAQTAAATGPARSTRHIALADLCGWPLYSVETARITLHLTMPAPPGPDGVAHTAVPATATATMTVTIRLSTRPGRRSLADDLAAAALTPAPPSVDGDRLTAAARRAVAAWRHLPGLYRSARRVSDEAPDHPATTTTVQTAEDLATAVCTWCAGGPPVDTRLLARAPRPDALDPDAPPALIALATTVSRLRDALAPPEPA
ncbi:hypothetical protein ACH4D3_18805 [Streptomyces sp. NPDC018026]|uniref:hypothetical protein n=1 Tax=Streptomyces sp. NPDC018026 TaxID=3365031 RepID=UPI0037ACC03E